MAKVTEKKCSKCGEVKAAGEFRDDKRNTSTGLKSQCRECERSYAKEYHDKYPEKCKESKKKYRENGGLEKDKEWAQRNKDKRKVSKVNYRKNNRDKVNAAKRRYRANNIDKCRENDRKYYDEHKDIINEQAKNRRDSDPDYYKTQHKIKVKRLEKDSTFKTKETLRKNIYKWITRGGYNKITNTELTIGCTYDEFIVRAEALFLPEMTWDNYGKIWDFDHTVPVSYAITDEEVMNLNHYTNLKPMYSEENRYIKSNNVFYNEYDLDYVLNEWI